MTPKEKDDMIKFQGATINRQANKIEEQAEELKQANEKIVELDENIDGLLNEIAAYEADL